MKLHLLILLLLTLCLKQFGQTYPSGITTSLLPPYSIFINEYANPLSPKIKASVVFTDFTEPSWDVYLKVKITGPNINIETKPNTKPPQAVTVIPGVPYDILGADLDWYFNNSNLNFSGTSRAQLEANNNRLPEGFYTFCFEVLDYQTGRKISLPSCASAYLALNDPPLVIAPPCGKAIENLNQQNILFQWQIANTNGSLNVSSLNYQIDLYEVNSTYANPLMAIANNQALPVWQSQPITQNSYLYGPTEPALEKGKRYAFTVKAIEDGKSQVKNNGLSQACWFYYGYPEGGTITLNSLPNNYQLSLKDNGVFSWSRPSNVISNSQMVGYQFKIAPLLSGQDEETAIINNTPFFEYTTEQNTSAPKEFALAAEDMMRLTKMKPYVWQVKGISGNQEIAKSAVYKFTGPPVIEKFIAGGFDVIVTELSSYDSVNYVVSGKGKVILNALRQAPEFSFSNIKLRSIGSNNWVMQEGNIQDAIILNPYVLTPDSVKANKNAEYVVDSIYISTEKLELAGFVSWKFPLGVTGNTMPYINGKQQHLTLNQEFALTSSDYNSLSTDYTLNLLEPGDFIMHLNKASQVYVKASTYNFDFKGSIELPESVQDVNNTRVEVPFTEAGQLFYISQQNVSTTEGVRFVPNTNMQLKPRHYVFDFSERISCGDVSADSTWKGLYINKASVVIPPNSENTNQISTSGVLDEFVFNNITDSTTIMVTQNGLTFKTRVAYNPATDTLKFNTFPSVNNEFVIDVTDNVVNASRLTGSIQVPVLDTARAFPYYIALNEFGFGTGYLLNALNNYSFTFCAACEPEKKVDITISRALFKNNNRLEMDMDLVWPHFNLNLTQLQKFCAWGNGNIGFETPNGIAPLTYQQNGSFNGYDIQAEKIGCGRVANLYSFGISSRIIMAEDIAGEDGAPINNAYTMYKNPLLNGDYTSMSFSMGSDTSSTVSSAQNTSANTDNLTTNVNQTLSDLGIATTTVPVSDNTATGDLTGTSNGNPIISTADYDNIQKIIQLAEIIVPYIDKSEDSTGTSILNIGKFIVNNEGFQRMVNKSPEDLVNDLILEATDAIIAKINRPIIAISTKATTAIATFIHTKATAPITAKIDTLINKAFVKIKETLLNQLKDQDASIKNLVTDVINSVHVNLANQVRSSIVNAVDNNITNKLTGFIEVGITGKITGFVRTEIRTVATNIINNGAGNSVNLNNIAQNAETLFKDVGDTIVSAVSSLNLNTIVNTTQNVANDIVKGIDFGRIGENVIQELINKNLTQAVTSLITSQLGEMNGAGAGIAKAVLSTVKFDCTNIGDKLKNGRIDQIVKFDFTNIYITVGVADVQGQLKFTKDDPIYGNSFQAMVDVTIKAPDKKKPIRGSLKFINGKTADTLGKTNFAYWFFNGKLMGLNLKLGSIPFTVDGFEGTVYSKMKVLGVPQPLPDSTNKYGIGAKMYLFDTPTNGEIIAFDVALNVVVNNGGFVVGLIGNAKVGNLKSKNSGGSASLYSIATATGGIVFSSEAETIIGTFDVKFNTAPLLCAGGGLGVNVDGKHDTWQVCIGKKATPIQAKLLCKDNLASGGYFDMKQSGIEAGFFLHVGLEAETPWIGGENLKVKGWANFGVGIDAYTSISFNPKFKINQAYIYAEANAGIGFSYKTEFNSGSVTIAGVSLAGSLLYINETPENEPERSELHGSMSGSVEILNTKFGVGMQVDYDLKNNRKI